MGYCKWCEFDNECYNQQKERQMLVKTLSPNETIFFYPYSKINETWVMEEMNHSITDPDIECGLLIFRHNDNYNNQRQERRNYRHFCNEDSCLTHLKYLHDSSSINQLKNWRNETDYVEGVKAGGKTCGLLQIYGTAILIPILLNLSFNLVLFVNDFRNQKANMFEIVPLVLLFYPQYKTMKFLAQYLIHRDETVLNREKEENDRTVAQLEPFLESAFQVRHQIH